MGMIDGNNRLIAARSRGDASHTSPSLIDAVGSAGAFWIATAKCWAEFSLG
jgi:hypothetical protein